MPQTKTAAVVDYAMPDIDVEGGASRFARWIASALRQLAHRCLAIALIFLLCGIGAWAANKTPTALLLWAFAAADVSLLAAVLLISGARRQSTAGREALVAACVAGGTAVVSLTLYFVASAYRGA